MEDANKKNYTLTIVDIPKYVYRFFMKCGLDDYLTRGVVSWDVPVNDITILGNHHFKIKTSLSIGIHINFYSIEEEINDYASGKNMKDNYYHLPHNKSLTDELYHDYKEWKKKHPNGV